jgi:hypothetical protein
MYDGGKEEDRDNGSLAETIGGLEKAKVIGKRNRVIRAKGHSREVEETILQELSLPIAESTNQLWKIDKNQLDDPQF